MLTLAEAKHQCSITHSHDDVYIETVILPAALVRLQNRIKRKIYATQADLNAAQDETGVVFDDVLKIVAYMYVYDLYENRQIQESEQLYFNRAVKDMLANYVNHL